MTPSTLKLFLASLALSSFAVVGCAADTSAVNGDAEDEIVSVDETTSRTAEFAGSYRWRSGDSGELVDFQQLTLETSGRYTAMVESALVDPAVRCIAFPCTLAESGKLNVRVNPTGTKPSRSYFISIEPTSPVLTLTRHALHRPQPLRDEGQQRRPGPRVYP